MGTYSKLVQSQPVTNNADMAEDLPVSKQADNHEAMPASQIASNNSEKVASQSTSKHADKPARKLAEKLINPQLSLPAEYLDWLQEKPTQACTFRYPPDLVEAIDDVLHAIRKQHRVKLTKNAIGVAAIVYLLAEYETGGVNSALYRLLIAADLGSVHQIGR